MPSYYTYLISSLPLLAFGIKPPFSLEEFLEACFRVIKDTDLKIIKDALSCPDYKEGLQTAQILGKWRAFNASLRSELAYARAGRKKVDPTKYIRHDVYVPASTAHAAMSAYRNQNILEAEKSLDLERWRFLDEASFGHYFDIDFLLAYALKLKILIRWDKINRADKEALLNAALNKN